MLEHPWSKTEKTIAREAFDRALVREKTAILNEVRSILATAKDPNVIWRIHDYLGKRRRDIDEKYDFRYSVLILVFARLVNEGWLTQEDLAGLREEKIASIENILRL